MYGKCKTGGFKRRTRVCTYSNIFTGYNESTAGADASVEALKLYHMKLTLAYSSLLALLALVAQTQLILLVGRIVQKNGK